MIDISPLLTDCPFRAFCIMTKGDIEDEQFSDALSADVSTPTDEWNNLGAGN